MDGERVSHWLGALQKTSPSEECRELPAIQAIHWHAGGRAIRWWRTRGKPTSGKINLGSRGARKSPLRVGQRKTGGKKNQKKTNVSCQQLHTKLINGVPAVGDPQRAAFKKSSPILPKHKTFSCLSNASAVLFFPRSIWAFVRDKSGPWKWIGDNGRVGSRQIEAGRSRSFPLPIQIGPQV